jgi:hypothetical protein
MANENFEVVFVASIVCILISFSTTAFCIYQGNKSSDGSYYIYMSIICFLFSLWKGTHLFIFWGESSDPEVPLLTFVNSIYFVAIFFFTVLYSHLLRGFGVFYPRMVTVSKVYVVLSGVLCAMAHASDAAYNMGLHFQVAGETSIRGYVVLLFHTFMLVSVLTFNLCFVKALRNVSQGTATRSTSRQHLKLSRIYLWLCPTLFQSVFLVVLLIGKVTWVTNPLRSIVTRAIIWNVVAVYFLVEMMFQRVLLKILSSMDMFQIDLSRCSLDSRVATAHFSLHLPRHSKATTSKPLM